jgi:prepilin-type processing-associated H-X9-DG protein
VLRPSDTIFVAEVDGNSATEPAQSNVTGRYAVGRHERRGQFAMCDGSARALRTNDFLRTAGAANSAAVEWETAQAVYWYPTPTTPN